MASFRDTYISTGPYWPFDEAAGVNQSIVEKVSAVSSNNDLTTGLVNTGYSLITDGVGTAVQYKSPHLNIWFDSGSVDQSIVCCFRPAEDVDNLNSTVFNSGEGGGGAGSRILLALDDLNLPTGGIRNYLNDATTAGFIQDASHGFVPDQIQPICVVWSWDYSAQDFRVVMRNFDGSIDFSGTDTSNTANVPAAPGMSLGANQGLSVFRAYEYFELGRLTGTYHSVADMQDTADEVLAQAALDAGLISLPPSGTPSGRTAFSRRDLPNRNLVLRAPRA